MGYLATPTGKRIVATAETIPGRCEIIDVALDTHKGNKFDLCFAGGTDVDWDNQKTVAIEGQRLFIDEDDHVWLESQLTFHLDHP